MNRSHGRAAARLLRFLARGVARVEQASIDHAMLLHGEQGTIAVAPPVLRALLSDGALLLRGQTLALTQAGKAAAGRLDADAESAFQKQHRQDETAAIPVAGDMAIVLRNAAESPLGSLLRHTRKDGRPFLEAAEFASGEKLRADYTIGQIMPRLGANWEASVASSPRSQAGASVTLTDAALSARQRVEKALAAVGPELSGVLVDVCCFLKGLELVERERGWPVRSAKIVLKTALGVLARHYDPQLGRERRGPTLHWGSEGYRPALR